MTSISSQSGVAGVAPPPPGEASTSGTASDAAAPRHLEPAPGLAPNRAGRPAAGGAQPPRNAQVIAPAPAAIHAAGEPLRARHALSPAPLTLQPLPAHLMAELQQWAADPSRAPGEQREEAIARIQALIANPQPQGRLGESGLRDLNLFALGLTRLPENLGVVAAHARAQQVTLSGNALQDLPASLDELPLQALWLADNQFTEVPPAVTRMRHLHLLDLHNNRITALPAAIGQLVNLRDLHLQGNQLQTLPDDLVRLERLQNVQLQDNQLTEVPDWIGCLQHLRHLDLRSNPLETLPASWPDLPADCVVWLWNTLDPQTLREAQQDSRGRRGPMLHIDGPLDVPPQDVVDFEIRRPVDWDAISWPPGVVDDDIQPPVTRPLATAVLDWRPPPSGAPAGAPPVDWSGFADQPQADAFSLWLDRLRETAEYLHAPSRPGLVQRVQHVLSAIEQDQDLREQCFDLAWDALRHCEDRIALGLDNIEQAVDNRRAERGELGQAELLQLCRRRFRRQQIDRLAANHARRPERVHEAVETVLAYRTGLAAVLDTGPGVRQMAHFVVGGVTATDLQWAAVMVEMLERGPALAESLAGQAAWQQHLERSHPQAYKALRDRIAAERDRLLFVPEGMNDQAYRNATAALHALETEGPQAIHLRLTHQILAAQGNPAPVYPSALTGKSRQ